MTPDPGNDYMTVAEAAALLSVSQQAIRKLINNGKLRAIEYEIGAIRVYVLKADVERISKPRPIKPRK